MRSRGTVLLATVLALLAALAACGSTDDGTEPKDGVDASSRVRVSGEVGSKPEITVSAPLDIAQTRSETEKSGDGDPVGAQAKVILQLTVANARTGRTTVSTYDEGQGAQEVQLPDQLFPEVVQAITGKPSGSRVVTYAAADAFQGGLPQLGLKEGDGAVVVTDVLSTDPTTLQKGPTGATPATKADQPRLVGSTSSPTGFDVSGLTKPKKLQVFTLREGTGPAIDGPTRVATDYLGEVWGGKEAFDGSYVKEPVTFSVGLGKVIPAWDKALQGVKEGSRVVLVCPPDTAYGNQSQPNIPAGSTLVFVIDVLGVG